MLTDSVIAFAVCQSIWVFFGRPSPVEVNAAHLNLSHQVALCEVIRLSPRCGGGDVCVTTKLWKLWKHLHASRVLICVRQNFSISAILLHFRMQVFKYMCWNLSLSGSDTPLNTKIYIYFLCIHIVVACLLALSYRLIWHTKGALDCQLLFLMLAGALLWCMRSLCIKILQLNLL